MADLAIAIKIATEDASSGPIDKIKGALGGLGNAVAAPKAALGGLVSGLGQLGLAAQGVEAVVGAAKGIGGMFGIGALNELEQTRASFMAFTKDAGKTEELLAGVRKEAALTPFAFGEMAKATASLLPVAKSSGVGIEDLRKQAEILAASNPMEGLEGASFSLREAMTGDFTSIIERFNLSRSSINKWKEEGVPNIEIVRRAMAEMGFDSDLIAAKAETLDGRWSTFQDTLVTLQTKLGQPIFDVMKESLVGLQSVFDDNMGTFEAWADSAAAGIAGVIEATKGLLAIFLGGGDFEQVGEMLDHVFPMDVSNAIMAAVSDLGGVFEKVFQGDIPAAVEYALGFLEDLGGIIGGLVESWASAIAGWVDGADSELLGNLGAMSLRIQAWIFETGLALVEKLGTWAAAFIDWIGPKIPDLLRELGAFLAGMLGWLGGTALPTLVEKLAEWGLAFVEWIAPRIPPLLLEAGKLLLELGGWLIGTALPAIVEKLAEWGLAFVEWVAPRIPPLLVELAALGMKVGEWLITTGLPALVEKLGQWGTAFVDWVGPKIPPLLLELAKLLVEVNVWLITTALPAIVGKLVEWGGAFLNWIAKDVLPTLPEKLGAILTAIGGWVAEKASAVAESVKAIGSGILTGIQNGISGALSGFWSWLQNNFVDKIPSFVRELLNIHSPSGVFADIGRNIVEGLRVGMESRLPSVEDVIKRVIGSVGQMGGAVDDWLKAAITYTGVGMDWLPGLKWIVGHESGGDPTAKNPDSTASGLLQLIDTTWANSRDKRLPNDVFNPVLNAIAGIRYIAGRYGDPDSAIAFWRKNNYYADGGWITEPVMGIGLRSGQGYTFGERGEDELVTPRSRLGRGARGGDGLAVEIARELAPLIARTRPITNIGTAEQLARQTRRLLDREARDHASLRGVRR